MAGLLLHARLALLHQREPPAHHRDDPPCPGRWLASGAGNRCHVVFSGVGASEPVTITCDNGFTLPFALPAGASSEPFDIAATDGTVIDLDSHGGSSNPFVTVPANFSGHTHVALTRSS